MIAARGRRGTAIDARTADTPLRVLGIDPGTLHTGWGIVERTRRGLVYRAAGTLSPHATFGLSERLRRIHAGLAAVVREWRPHVVSLEKTTASTDRNQALRDTFDKHRRIAAGWRVASRILPAHGRSQGAQG